MAQKGRDATLDLYPWGGCLSPLFIDGQGCPTWRRGCLPLWPMHKKGVPPGDYFPRKGRRTREGDPPGIPSPFPQIAPSSTPLKKGGASVWDQGPIWVLPLGLAKGATHFGTFQKIPESSRNFHGALLSFSYGLLVLYQTTKR